MSPINGRYNVISAVPASVSLTAFGHFRDRWIHGDGQWKSASLRLTLLIMDFG